MNEPKVTIVVLQFNNSHSTIGCLNSVKELGYPNFDVIIVDNASELKHLNNVRLFVENQNSSSNFTHYSLVTNSRNSGYAGGNNDGIRHALQCGADYLLILNPDVIVGKDLLTELIKAAGPDDKVGILGPVINENGKPTYCGKIRWLKPELEHLEIKNRKDSYIPGACLLIKRGVVERVGFFDERYFLYFEDADYCLRAQKAGYGLKVVTEATVNHAVSSSTGRLGAPLLLRYHFRNAHLFNLKNGPLWAKLALPFWSIFIIVKQAVKLAIGRNRQISKAILSGVIDFYRGRFGQIC